MQRPGRGIHDRRSIRLRHHDYRHAGAYFVTICTFDRFPLFGSISNEKVRLSKAGEIVQDCWREIPLHFPNATLDHFIIMPDHMHGIIVIRSGGRPHPPMLLRRFGGSLKGSLSTMIGVFKSDATQRIMRVEGIRRVWQRNYYESIIRNAEHLAAIRKYIIANPKRWRGRPGNT